jgi:hypothetical protein
LVGLKADSLKKADFSTGSKQIWVLGVLRHNSPFTPTNKENNY